jgi:hypothetical protein
MPVGLPAKTTYANGDVFSASDINDTNGTINLIGQTQNFYAGKNRIINGDFGVWQRGSSFNVTSSGTYLADRFAANFNGSGATRTVSRQAFTPGAAPVAGYEGEFFLRYAQSVAGTGSTLNVLSQRIEDVRTFAGQTVTVSFWAKAAASTTVPSIQYYQNMGSGGSGDASGNFATNVALTTSWQRFSYSLTLPSLSGKTLGTSSFLAVDFYLPLNATFTIDVWGVQLEAGSTATAFETASGSIQGELALCQRYYYAADATVVWWGNVTSGNNYYGNWWLPVPMRVAPTVATTDVSNTNFNAGAPSTTVVGKFSFWAFKGSSGTGVGNFQFNYTASAEL